MARSSLSTAALPAAALIFALSACNTEKPELAQKNSPAAQSVTVTAAREQATNAAPPPAPMVMGRISAFAAMPQHPGYWQPDNTSKFPDAKPNAVVVTAEQPVSTFSIDVDTASYGYVRDALNDGALPQADAVRVEEMVNYFDYSYPLPENRTVPFRASIRVYPTPWNKETQILHIGIKGFDIPKKDRPPANLVFLINSSGPMADPKRRRLLKSVFNLLAAK